MSRRPTMRLARLVVWVLAVLAFAAQPAAGDPIRWPQPGGPGSRVELTYSFSNLLDGGFITTLTADELRSQVAWSLAVWARHAPVHFVEVRDRGPRPSEYDYQPGVTPQIRFGYIPFGTFGELAHAHFPIDVGNAGLAGDVHFANDIARYSTGGVTYTWGNAIDAPGHIDFFSVSLHEVGHVLGLPHLDQPSVMYATLLHTFPVHEYAHLKANDIAALRTLYGSGSGSVTPLGSDSAAPVPEPASLLLAAIGLVPLVRRRVRQSRAFSQQV